MWVVVARLAIIAIFLASHAGTEVISSKGRSHCHAEMRLHGVSQRELGRAEAPTDLRYRAIGRTRHDAGIDRVVVKRGARIRWPKGSLVFVIPAIGTLFPQVSAFAVERAIGSRRHCDRELAVRSHIFPASQALQACSLLRCRTRI